MQGFDFNSKKTLLSAAAVIAAVVTITKAADYLVWELSLRNRVDAVIEERLREKIKPYEEGWKKVPEDVDFLKRVLYRVFPEEYKAAQEENRVVK